MSVYDKRQQLRQQEMDEDQLLKIMYGMEDVDVGRILEHLKRYELTDTETQARQVEAGSGPHAQTVLDVVRAVAGPRVGVQRTGSCRDGSNLSKRHSRSWCADMLEGRIVTPAAF